MLHADSFHPTPLKNSTPFGQYLCLHRNCSDENSFKEEAGKLQDRLLERGYSRSCLRKAFNKAATKSRNDLLFKTQVKQTSDCNKTRLIMCFSKQHKQIRESIQRHWSILTDDLKIQKFVSNTPSITFRRAMSIKDRLVTSEFRGELVKEHCPARGSFPFGHCSHCPFIRREKTFLLPNGEMVSPPHFANCQTVV